MCYGQLPTAARVVSLTRPIARRGRSDTIRCVVSSLIEDGNPLFVELRNSDAKLVSDSRDEAENYNDPKWTPDPVDAPSSMSLALSCPDTRGQIEADRPACPDYRRSKGADVIQLLVSIYDTKDVFIKELQVLLAQRLLAIRDYALEQEVSPRRRIRKPSCSLHADPPATARQTKNLEILKTRFGAQALQGCEVMLKDLQDSKQLDVAVHNCVPVRLLPAVGARFL